MQTPILFITFNRPHHTSRVLEAILAAQPQELYVFQDAPREGNTQDEEKCAAVRAVIEEMGANAQVRLHTYYPEHNRGCGPGPAGAISWFFEQVEEGIIIEDDALPSPEFFDYATRLLEKYRHDVHVRAIGSMKIFPRRFGNGSYYFSSMNRNLCAWATWRRAWRDFDYQLKGVTYKSLNMALSRYGATLREREYWCSLVRPLQKDGIGHTSWDIQFLMSIWLQGGKGICPNANLSTNMGFDEGTHVDNQNIAANVPLETILPLRHPSVQTVVRKADLLYHKTYFQPYEYGLSGFSRLPYRLNKRLKRFLGHQGPWFK